ncbi:hypothetical protein HOH51_03290 [bacterium]|jgi:hypothetical protein|nr:hypothetical protein [bacterium]
MSIRTLNTDEVRELYQEKGIDIEVLMGSPLETVLTTGAITTFIFTRRSVTLPYIQQIINQQRLAIELESEDLFYTDISILNEIFCIVNINRQAEVAIIQSKNSKETRAISIDALRYYLSHAIKEEIRTIEADFNSRSITGLEAVRSLKIILEKIQKTFGFSDHLNFHSGQALERTLETIIENSHIKRIDQGISSWSDQVLANLMKEVQFSLNFLEPFEKLQLTTITKIKRRITKYKKKIEYKLEMLEVVSQTQNCLNKYQECTSPIPHLWFDLNDLQFNLTQIIQDLKASGATIPEFANIFVEIANVIAQKLITAETQSDILFTVIYKQLEKLKELAFPQTVEQAYDQFEIILENIKLKNIHHLQKSLVVSIFQEQELKQHHVQIPEMYAPHTIQIPPSSNYEELLSLFNTLHSQRIKWAQSEEIQINEELENLSCTHPSRFYNQVHISIRQKKLGQLLHAKEQERKESRIRELISKLTGITFSDKELKK